MIYVQSNFAVMDISGSIFGDMNLTFPNLKSTALDREGIYGSITPKTFDGIENIELMP